MTKTLKPFQIQAIEQINRFTTKVLSDKDLNNPIVVLKSPTGSGKTLMLTKIIENIVESNRLSLAFIWISIGSGDLHIQSARAVSKYISKKFKINELSTNSNLSRTHLLENEILFLNWEKIYTKKNDQFTNVIMRDSENINLPFFLEETRKKNRKIVLIIDEAHRNTTTERAKELKDLYIKPDAIIEASATPILEHSYIHEVSINDVIDQGLIKKAIYINDSIDDIENMDELDSFQLVVDKAIEKRKNIQLELLKLNINNLNPLILFQIPDSQDGEIILNKLRNYLDLEHNISETNNKLGVWLSNTHRDFSKDLIVKNDSPIECLIFKKAISTGWDCPRAWILVKFRQIKTETFMIQTVGRILRMPYAHHFDNEILDNGYVYTNLEKIQVNQDPYAPNIIKNKTSKCRSKINRNLNIKSYYKSRGGDYNDIDATYNEFLINFALGQNKKTLNQFLTFKLNDIKQDLFKDEIVEIENFNLDINKTTDNTIAKLSYEDLQTQLVNFIKKHIININVSRSMPVIRLALFRLIKKLYPQLSTRTEFTTIIFNNKEYFEKLLDNSITQFRSEKIKKIKNIEKYKKMDFEIPQTKQYNDITHKTYKSKKSAHQPLYLQINQKSKNFNKLETDFIDYLETHNNVEWFWVNGSEHMETNFGIKVQENMTTFQPDFIVKFQNNKLGIFDTKGMYKDSRDTKLKAEALQAYIKNQNQDGLFGGIIIQNKNTFYINQKDIYKSFDTNIEDWETIDSIFKS